MPGLMDLKSMKRWERKILSGRFLEVVEKQSQSGANAAYVNGEEGITRQQKASRFRNESIGSDSIIVDPELLCELTYANISCTGCKLSTCNVENAMPCRSQPWG